MTYMAYIYNNVSSSTITYLNPDEGLHVQHPSLIADLLFSLLPPQHYHPLRHGPWLQNRSPTSSGCTSGVSVGNTRTVGSG